MAFPKTLKMLCKPALIYFVISMLGLTISIFQNLGNSDIYTLGSFSCNVPSTLLVFIVKIIYILFWTWILNLICKDGNKMISWVLVLFPFIISFVLMGLLMIQRESFITQPPPLAAAKINTTKLSPKEQKQILISDYELKLANLPILSGSDYRNTNDFLKALKQQREEKHELEKNIFQLKRSFIPLKTTSADLTS